MLPSTSFSIFAPEPPTPRPVFDKPVIIERVSLTRSARASAALLAKRIVGERSLAGAGAEPLPSGVLQDIGASGE